jgi:rhodanese-related sulfurtransferase
MAFWHIISRQTFYAYVLLSLFSALVRGDNACSSGKCNASGPYCGINCIYGILKLSHKEIKFTDLLKPGYIGTRKGSSLAELRTASQDNGMYAEAVSNFSIDELSNLPNFVILHVKSTPQIKEYDHYQLFLGTKDGKAQLLDPPNPVQLVSFGELAPLWDGTGLIVSDKPIDLNAIFWPARKRFFLYAIAAIATVLTIRLITKKLYPTIDRLPIHKSLGLSLLQGGGLTIIALLAGLLFHFFNEAGFLASANATASIQQAHLANFMPKLSTSQLRQDIPSGTVVIDARYKTDYEAGHIADAINIPVDLCDAGRAGALSKIDKNAKIVVYCQSAGCKFAETVAAKLHSDGFSNISIYKGGWQEWQSKKK